MVEVFVVITFFYLNLKGRDLMITPNVNQVLKMSNEYNLIPVVKRILADMETPIRIFRRYADNDRAFCLKV